MQISILQGSESATAIYTERHFPETNRNGLVSIEIGTGTIILGDFTAIDWANDIYFIKTETDINGSANYTITDTNQLLSVPYALHAKTAEIITGSTGETDPVYSGSQAANITEIDITNLANLSGINTGDQDLSEFLTSETDPVYSGSQAANITETDITNLANLSGINTGDQDLSGFLTSETDGDIYNEIQSLSVSGTGDTLYLSKANWIIVPGISAATLHDPVLEVQFEENPITHNIHITSDGNYYYTINGGSSAYGNVNQFDKNGNLLNSYPILIDGRGLSYNKADGYLYASLYLGDIVKITDLANGTFETIYSDKMQSVQASFAISDDGTKFYDFYAGTLKVYNFSNGNLLETITGLSCGSGSSGDNVAVAVDPYYIYTWDASTRTVYVYNHSGTLQRTMTLDYGNYGFSLSCFEGFLFVAVDGNYSTGTWYGYNIRRSVNQTKSAEINKTLNLKSSNITIKPDFDSTDK